MQISVLSTALPLSLFHFNKFRVSQGIARQWKLSCTCQIWCCAFCENPQKGGKEVKVFYLTCLLLHLVQLLCESLCFRSAVKGKVDYYIHKPNESHFLENSFLPSFCATTPRPSITGKNVPAAYRNLKWAAQRKMAWTPYWFCREEAELSFPCQDSDISHCGSPGNSHEVAASNYKDVFPSPLFQEAPC